MSRGKVTRKTGRAQRQVSTLSFAPASGSFEVSMSHVHVTITIAMPPRMPYDTFGVCLYVCM